MFQLKNLKKSFKHIADYVNIFIFAISNLYFEVMARFSSDFDVNKNAVIIHYSHLLSPQPYDRPIGCVVKFLDYYIHASVFDHKFYVGDYHKLWKEFSNLKDAKNFIRTLVNKNRTFF